MEDRGVSLSRIIRLDARPRRSAASDWLRSRSVRSFVPTLCADEEEEEEEETFAPLGVNDGDDTFLNSVTAISDSAEGGGVCSGHPDDNMAAREKAKHERLSLICGNISDHKRPED